MKRYSIYILFTALLFISCERDNNGFNGHVAGVVLDDAFIDKPVEGATVTLSKYLFDEQEYVYFTGITDEDGIFNINGLENTDYDINISHPDYKMDGPRRSINAGNYDPDEVYELTPASKVYIRVSSTLGEHYGVKLYNPDDDIDCLITGENQDTTIVMKVARGDYDWITVTYIHENTVETETTSERHSYYPQVAFEEFSLHIQY